MISYHKIIFEVLDSQDEDTLYYFVVDNKYDEPYTVQKTLDEAIEKLKESKPGRNLDDLKACIEKVCDEHGWGLEIPVVMDVYY